MHVSERYIRQTQIPDFGEKGQQKLLGAKVLVIGAGGLGVPVLQYLTAMGIGTLGIVDGDAVSVSNLHRQVIYRDEDIGKKKVVICEERLKKQNPATNIKTYPYFLSRDNALELIESYDLVMDATDNFEARYLINDACVILHKPFIYGALQGYEGHVSVFNYQDGPTYRCLYPDPPDAGQIPDCNEAGVLGIVPGIIGSYQVLEAIKVLSGIGKPLSGELLVLDLLTHRQFKMKLKTNPVHKQLQTLQDNYELAACQSTASIEPDELADWYEKGKKFILLDVREPHEFKDEHLKDSLSLPLSEWEHHQLDFPAQLPWVVVCQAGGRSKKAMDWIQRMKPEINVFNLEGGLNQWVHELGDTYLNQ